MGQGSGPYAKALSEEIVKPGIEAVTMFRNVQLKVREAIGQDPWLSFPTLPPVYFAGQSTKPRPPAPSARSRSPFGSRSRTKRIRRCWSATPEAIHYVVFDACRDELHLTREGKKAIGSEKGFLAMGNISGVMVAYATAPGRTASDGARDGGVYAKALSEEIVKPGIEAVTMFRSVQLKVKQAIGQNPWLSFPPLPAVYFAGTQSSLTREQQRELDFWLSVKDSTVPSVLRTYLERYPHGEFAAIAATLAEHYDRKLKAEQAAQEAERRRLEEERKAAEVTRLEDERRVREAAIAEERKRLETDEGIEEGDGWKNGRGSNWSNAPRSYARLSRIAREAATAAEDQRLAAVRAAEEATKAAETAIATKRDAERKVVALPKLDGPRPKEPKKAWDPHDLSRTITPGGYKTCGSNGCQTVPKGCHAVRNAGGGGLGGKIFCP